MLICRKINQQCQCYSSDILTSSVHLQHNTLIKNTWTVMNTYSQHKPSPYTVEAVTDLLVPRKRLAATPASNSVIKLELTAITFHQVAVWHSGSALVSITDINLRWARLVLRWVTVSGFNSLCRTFISVCNQPHRPTQPLIPPGTRFGW